MVSIRARASRGVLAWTVVSEPSWPVFMACNMSSASSPRTSPTTMRSGRIRRALTTSWRWRIAPLPSTLAGRVSRRATCSWCSCSSAASSIVTMRSCSEMKLESTFSSVVLPAPVPPLIRQFSRARTQCDRNSSIGAVSAPRRHQVVRLQAFGRKPADGQQRAVHRQRRDDGVDARAVGQARVHHRRAVVHAAADAADDAVDDAQQVRVVLERGGDALQPAARARRRPAAAVFTRMSLIAGSRSSGSSGPRPNTSSSTSAKSVSRSRQAERRRLLGEQLAEQRADFRLRRAGARRAPAPRGSGG